MKFCGIFWEFFFRNFRNNFQIWRQFRSKVKETERPEQNYFLKKFTPEFNEILLNFGEFFVIIFKFGADSVQNPPISVRGVQTSHRSGYSGISRFDLELDVRPVWAVK
jgi:hypothetical protein